MTIIPKTTYTYNYLYESSRPHAVTSTGDITYQYDGNGNMISRTSAADPTYSMQFTWDEENRLTRTQDMLKTTDYKYDDRGKRIIKNGNAGEQVFVNDNFSIRNGDVTSKHIFAGNTRIATKIAMSGADPGIYFYHGDHLGSSSVITNNLKSFNEHLEYFPYGETWIQEKATAGSESMPYKFTGQMLDSETGLYYFGARYYEPRLSRWISADKAFEKYLPKAGKVDRGLPGLGGVYNQENLNVYNYTGNNPVKLVDPDGNYMMLAVLPIDRNHTGCLYLYNDSGALIGSYTILGKGLYGVDSRFSVGGDTPTGIFKITGRGEFSKKDPLYQTYGPMFLLLKGTYGEAGQAEKPNGDREKIGVHGGPERGRRDINYNEEGGSLSITEGCLRGGNADIQDIQNKIKQIEEKRGYETGQAPNVTDSVHVFDTYPNSNNYDNVNNSSFYNELESLYAPYPYENQSGDNGN